MEPGIRGMQKEIVTEDKTAAKVGSGLLPVYATPSMIALIENTASTSVQPELEPGQGTVGTKLDIAHVAATPLGMTIRCETELTDVDRRKLVFTVKVYDDAGLVGEGTHERFIIDEERFMQKADAKKAK